MQALDETAGYRQANRATARLALWTLAWTASLALAKFAPDLLWDAQQTAASWAAVAANFVVGLGWIVAFTRFLRDVDELERQILLEALAAALGVGWVSGFAYVVADAAGLVDDDVDVAVLPVLMAVVYMGAFVVGKIRYR